MPVVVPLVAAAAGYGVSAAIGGGILGALAGGIISTGISQIGGGAFAKKPKAAAATSLAEQASGLSTVVRSAVASHKVVYGTTKVSGVLVHVATSDSLASNGNFDPKANKLLHMVIALAGHPVEEIGDVYFNDALVPLDGGGRATVAPYLYDGAPYAIVKKYLGAVDQPADAQMVADVPGWTPNHRLRGIAYVYVLLQYNQNVFPNGIPNVSAVVKGKNDVYDPRTASRSWTANAALCARDYLTSVDGAGQPYGFGCDADEVADDYFSAAANVSDEAVPLSTGGSQARYTCDGVVDTAAAPLDNLQDLLTACAGTVTYVQGMFRLHAAAYDAPSGTVTADMLAGPVKATKGVARKESFNAVKGTYIAPDKLWTATDFPPVANSTYRTEDDGEEVFKDLELPFTKHSEAAQRIAKITLEKSRQGITAEMPLTHAALQFAVFDTVYVDDAQLGWADKVFRVMKVATTGTGPITLSLQEESAASYDWNGGEATTLDPAPDTNLPDPFSVPAPGVPSVQEVKYATRPGAGVKVKAVVAWGASADAFLAGYQFEYRTTGTTDWTVLPRTADTAAEIIDVAPGRYDFRVKAVNGFSVSSPYATLSNKEIVGLGDRPADIAGLTMQAISSVAFLQWALPPDLDVTEGGQVLIRHSEAVTGATWAESYTFADPVPGGQPFAAVPLKEGTYLLKAEDSSGLQSVNATAVSTKNASVFAFTNLATVQEDATFPGTHAGTVATDGVLKLAGAMNIDDVPDFDAIATFDATGGALAAGTYTFATGIDLGSVTRARLETSLALLTVNVNDKVDSRTGMVDDWLDFDGTVAGGSVDAWVEARETDDDPAGTPVWKEWKRLAVGDYTCRAFQFRGQLRSYDPSYNVHVTRLRVTAKEVT